MGLERRRKAVVATGSTGKWRIPVATEEADHAQVEGSSAATFARTEPASDCPQLLSAQSINLAVQMAPRSLFGNSVADFQPMN
jgi:hypothetical protein